MIIAATNTVTIHTAPDQAFTVGAILNEMIYALRKSQGCIAYTAIKSHCEPSLWIITGHWLTQIDMENHFHDPAQEKYADLLSCRYIRSIEFGCRLNA
jgi:quinol monooxygenase YgiN